MGTRFEFVLGGGRDAARLRALAEEAFEIVAGLDRRLSRFRRDGLPAALARSGGTLRIPREEMVLLELCRRAHARSGGAFDPAFESALARPGAPTFADVRIERRARRVGAPAGAALLDFGAVAKGFALDLAARALARGGVRVALLHGGTSSVVALGAPPDRAAWGVALRDPSDRSRTIATVALRDAALSVSAPHGSTREVDGRRVGHVVDPRDGTAVRRVRLAAVVARHGATSEVASTALLVAAERALRDSSGRAVARCAALLPPFAAALVAFEAGGELLLELFGPRADLFTPVAAPRALAASASEASP
jgi:thiamine biosynthesis lipoprotein